MALSDNHKDQLLENVTSTESFEKLLPFLKSIHLDNLKQMVYQHIEGLNDINSQIFYLSSSSINEIMPTVIIGHILSFQSPSDLATTKRVNKEWYKLSNRSEKKYYMNLQRQLDRDCPIKFKYGWNNTWLVHDGRSKMTVTESEMQFKGVFPTISRAMSLHTRPGDRVFIHKGCHVIKRSIDCRDSISLIGLDKGSVVIVDEKSSEDTGVLYLKSNMNLYIQNLFFDGISHSKIPRKYGTSFVSVRQGTKLWAKKCSFFMRNAAIDAQTDGRVVIKKCAFHGGGRVPIIVEVDAGGLKVYNSSFRQCTSAVEIQNYHDSEPTLKLECKGNVFRYFSFAPFIEMIQKQGSAYSKCTELYSFEGNVIRASELMDIDVNRIYDIEFWRSVQPKQKKK